MICVSATGRGVVLPLRLVSEANAHEHWRIRQRRAKGQRFAAAMACRALCVGLLERCGELRVTIARVAPRALDSDNLVGSAKHVRDGVADALGISDRDPRVEWVVVQEQRPKTFEVKITIETKETDHGE